MSTVAGPVATVASTTSPLSFVLFGATGRTGIPFMRQALARGHRITAFTRSASRIPTDLAGNANLTAVELELGQSDKIEEAMAKARPDVVYVMLASDPAPHTAISTGTRAALQALRSMRAASPLSGAAATASSKPTPFVVIMGWGVGPTRALLSRWYERAIISLATSTFYAPVVRDFELTNTQLQSPKADGLIQPIVLMPPILTSGALTTTYESGDALTAMKDKMHTLDTVSRSSMAHLALSAG